MLDGRLPLDLARFLLSPASDGATKKRQPVGTKL